MDDVISVAEISATPTYKSLKNNKMQQHFLLKRATRKTITNALLIYKTTGIVKKDIGFYNCKVLQDLVENLKSTEK